MMCACRRCATTLPEEEFRLFRTGVNAGRRQKMCRKCESAGNALARRGPLNAIPAAQQQINQAFNGWLLTA